MTFSLNHNFNMIYKSLIKTVKNQKAGKLTVERNSTKF